MLRSSEFAAVDVRGGAELDQMRVSHLAVAGGDPHRQVRVASAGRRVQRRVAHPRPAPGLDDAVAQVSGLHRHEPLLHVGDFVGAFSQRLLDR